MELLGCSQPGVGICFFFFAASCPPTPNPRREETCAVLHRQLRADPRRIYFHTGAFPDETAAALVRAHGPHGGSDPRGVGGGGGGADRVCSTVGPELIGSQQQHKHTFAFVPVRVCVCGGGGTSGIWFSICIYNNAAMSCRMAVVESICYYLLRIISLHLFTNLTASSHLLASALNLLLAEIQNTAC